MNTIYRFSRPLALLLAATIAAAPAWAAPPSGHGGGQGKGQKHEGKGGQARKHEGKGQAHKQDKARKTADHRGSGDKGKRVAAKSPRPGAYFDDRNRDVVRTYYASAGKGGKGCPPGLAKKDNGCMPPGQAKKWHVGQPLPGDVVWYPVPQPILVSLPPVPVGHRYVQVAGDILLIAIGSKMVVDGIDGLLGR